VGRDLPDADGSWYLERERALSANTGRSRSKDHRR
jgi:hypothetical protein